MKSLRSILIPLFLALVVGVAGCAVPIGVRRVGPARVYHQVNANVLNQGVLSKASVKVLQSFDLIEPFEGNPDKVLATLHDKACREKSSDLLFALSELNYFTGNELAVQEFSVSSSRPYYLAAAIYAYLYLFQDRESVNLYDRRFRVASDLYNMGLAQALQTDKNAEITLESKIVDLPMGQMNVKVSRPGFPWSIERFSRFLPADDFEVRGLEVRNREPGLGLPLIAVPTPPELKEGATVFLAPKLKIPATAFLRVQGNVCEMTDGILSASLELYSPFDVPEIQVRNRKVPLEADLSAPLAYSLEESVLWKFATAAFFSGEQKLLKTGLYLVQPYQEGKIPVVFVHGTASSPATWAKMFNGLQGDHEIRKRFQFGFFIYTTGNPIAYSASLLRDSLREAVSTFDPAGTDPALKHMVVIGHSQGGLLTKMMVTESAGKFWRNLSDKSPEELHLTEEQRDFLRRSLFFEPLPFVRRVIFIATPHRGSFVAGNWIGKLFSKLVKLPVNMIKLGTGIFSKIPFPPEFHGQIPTSVDNMTPDHPFIKTLASIPVQPEVGRHSIIAVKGEGDPTQENDGVVAYKSAHLDDAQSELVVQSGHSVLGHPLAIGEVRRILLEHLREARLPRK